MLYAIEWIQVQLTAFYDFVLGFLGGLTLESIGSFLTRSPVLLVIYILAGLALVLVGFRLHKLVSSLAGGAVMGYLGWQVGAAINSSLISASVLWALIFAVIGLFLFYFLFVINVGIGAFLVSFAAVRQLLAVSTEAAALVGVVFTAIYCILLLRRHFIRTSVAGGTLLGLIALHYFGYIAALGVLAACIAGGTVLQNFLRKRYEREVHEAREFKPNAPSPPTPEEIAAEIAEEEADRAFRQNSDAYAGMTEAPGGGQ